MQFRCGAHWRRAGIEGLRSPSLLARSAGKARVATVPQRRQRGSRVATQRSGDSGEEKNDGGVPITAKYSFDVRPRQRADAFGLYQQFHILGGPVPRLHVPRAATALLSHQTAPPLSKSAAEEVRGIRVAVAVEPKTASRNLFPREIDTKQFAVGYSAPE